MKLQLFFKLFLIGFLLFIVNSQEYTPLELEHTIQATIAVGTQKSYSLTIPSSIHSTQQLYIRAAPQVADPFQKPYLKLSSTNDYKQNCFGAHAQFISYCRIPASELQSGREFKFSVSCSVECSLSIGAYISDLLRVEFGQELELTAYDKTGLTTVLTIQVPKSADYSALGITAWITNLEESIQSAKDGLDMFINYGNKDVAIPNEESFQVQGGQLYSGGRMSILSKDKVPAGSWIKVYIRMAHKMSVTFSVVPMKGDHFSLEIGHSYFDMVGKGKSKVYQIDTTNIYDHVQDQTIELVFDIFSGSTTITIGFDSEFKDKINVNSKLPSISLELTPVIRFQNNFKKIIYIKVDSIEDSELYFYSQLSREDATFMKPYIAYFDQLANKDIYTYIFNQKFVIDKDSKESTLKNYTFKVDVSSGKGQFFFTRCKNLQIYTNPTDQSLKTCLKKSSELTTSEFINNQIEAKTVISGSLMIINLQYDITKCQLVSQQDSEQSSKVYRQCAFQIIAQDLNPQPWTYTIYVERKYHINYLHEGKISKEYLVKGTYAYYAFSLPDYMEVEEISIFSATFSGKSVLIVSKSQKFPEITSNSSDLLVDVGSRSSIVLKGTSLSNQIYIAVYAQTFTEVNVGVKVHRKGGKDKNQVTLQNGNILPYTLMKDETQVRFKFVVRDPSDIVVHVNELVGLVQLKVLQENGTVVQCRQNGESMRQICRFLTDKDRQVLYAVVRGIKGKEQQFTISFSDMGHCKVGLLNTPIYVQLNGYVLDCYEFYANRPVALKYLSSLTHSQTAQRDIYVDVSLNGLIYAEVIQNQYQVSVSDMITKCPVGKKSLKDDFTSTCNVQIRMTSTTKSNKNFYFLLEEIDQEMALFDGIVERVTGVLAFGQQPKHFYFKVSQLSPIKIFASATVLVSDFFVVGTLVSKQAFAKRSSNQQLYPKYIPKQNRQTIDRKNLFFSNIGKTGTTALSISNTDLKSQGCEQKQCELLISVFPDHGVAQNNEGLKASFDLQVTQVEKSLQLGQTTTGFVGQGDFQTYIVNPSNGLISLRNMQNQDIRSAVCAKVMGALANGTIVKQQNVVGGGYLQMSRDDKIQHIIIKGNLPQCSYQISYTELDSPVHNVKLSQPYPIKLENGGRQNFLYYHENSVSFRIAKLISAGKLTAYILPIISRADSLKDMLAKDYKTFPMIDDGQREHIVKQDDFNFCQDCFYLVVVVAPTKFVGELVFLRFDDPIPLTANHALKEWLMPDTKTAVQHYIYYSLTDFNLTFEIITGTVKVKITSPDNNAKIEEELSTKRKFEIKTNRDGRDTQFYSQKALYQIQVKALSEAEFYIKIDKNRVTNRIFEGMPAKFQLTNIMPLALQFINGQKMEFPISLMVEISGHPDPIPQITFSVNVEQEGTGKVLSNQSVVLKKILADHTFILNLINIKGSYYMSVATNSSVNVTVLLVRKELTQLTPYTNHLFNNDGVYQLFTNQQNMVVQVYNCIGDFYILASKDIRDTQYLDVGNPSPISLKRPNYGGHYVFGVEGVYGSYFMRINPKQSKSDLQYLINYNYYDEINPYELIDAKNYDLTYTEIPQGLSLNLNIPAVVQGGDRHLKVKKIDYSVYISVSRSDLSRYSRCGIEGGVKKIVVTDVSQILLDKKLLQSLRDNQQKPPSSLYISVQAQIGINLSKPPKYKPQNAISKLTILYNVLQISLGGHKQYQYFFTDSLGILIGWLILPFALTGVMVYYLLQCCIRKFVLRQTDMIEEEIVPDSKPTIPSANKLAADGLTFGDPTTGQQMVKEHI